MLVASIDLMNGKAVQLRQGKELVLESDRDPIELAREFNRFGEVAVVDLDAALGRGNNLPLIEKICRVADTRVGGGIRSAETAHRLLKAGAQQLIIGTQANPEFLKQFPRELLIVALDHRDGQVTDHGWQGQTGESIGTRIERVHDYCGGFLCTFVEQEGGLQGIPIDQVKELQEKIDKPLTVAGGVHSEAEIIEISQLGIDVQVGMALYKGLIDPINSVIQSLNFNEHALIPTIVQDETGQVLMLAYSSRESLAQALREGQGIFFSRSRGKLWRKGETSGHWQELISCRIDCDRDTLVFTVRQTDGACHTNAYSCFGNATGKRKFTINSLFSLIENRKREMPEGSYTTEMFKDRQKLCEKIIEEASEVITSDSQENLRWEIADLLYFVSILAVQEGLQWKDIENELLGRTKP